MFQYFINYLTFNINCNLWQKEPERLESPESMVPVMVEPSEESWRSSSSSKEPNTSAHPAERYIFHHSAPCQKSRSRHLEMQRMQDHFRRRCLWIRHQRRHHRQSHNEPSQKTQRRVGQRSQRGGSSREKREENREKIKKVKSSQERESLIFCNLFKQ